MFVVCCVFSGLFGDLIPRSGLSFRVFVCLIVCEIEISTMRQPNPELDSWATAAEEEKKEYDRMLENTSIIICEVSEISVRDFSAAPMQHPCSLTSYFLNNFFTIAVDNVDMILCFTHSVNICVSFRYQRKSIYFICMHMFVPRISLHRQPHWLFY
jgi:hypothetical protein